MNNAVKRTINEDPNGRRCNHCSVDGKPTPLVVRTLGISRRDGSESCAFRTMHLVIFTVMTQLYVQVLCLKKLCTFGINRARKGSGAEAYASTRQMELEKSGQKALQSDDKSGSLEIQASLY